MQWLLGVHIMECQVRTTLLIGCNVSETKPISFPVRIMGLVDINVTRDIRLASTALVSQLFSVYSLFEIAPFLS